MKNGERHDRLRKDWKVIHTLGDLIEAREPAVRRSDDDGDALQDIELSEDADIEEALTFPHPKPKHNQNPEPGPAPGVEDLDEDWDAQDILPTDYSHGYDEMLTSRPSDDEDEMNEEVVNAIPRITFEEISEEPLIELMPRRFTPDYEPEEPPGWI